VHCIAISHSSQGATQKWLDLIGGAWNVEVVIDEDRSIYAAWGLGLGSVWYLFNPTSQVAGFQNKGWLGNRVAESIQRTGTFKREQAVTANANVASAGAPGQPAPGADAAGSYEGPLTTMGNKWQENGAWAVDGRGTIVWGGKALRADDLMDLEAGAKLLGL
jgi:hypothetical protein